MPPDRSMPSRSIPGKSFTIAFVLGLIGVLTISIPSVMVFEQAQGKIEEMRELWPSAWEEGFRDRYKQIDQQLAGVSSAGNPNLASFLGAWQTCRQQMQRSPMMDEQLPVVIEAEKLLSTAPSEIAQSLQHVAMPGAATSKGLGSFLLLQDELTKLPKSPLGRVAYPVLRLKHPPRLELPLPSGTKTPS
jgi:hypothetical protein